MKLLKNYEEKIREALREKPFVTLVQITEETEPQVHKRVYVELSAEEGSLIRGELWLPEEWTGIYMGSGNGGLGEGLPTDFIAEGLSRGFAAAVCDLGTSRGKESGIHNPAVWADFGHRATHLMTVTAKTAVEAAYGQKARLNFFKGGSTGGQQSLCLAQRYPEDYDVILCGAPANNRVSLHTYFLWNYVHLKDEDRKPLFDRETAEKICRFGVEYKQGRGDGQKGDAFITNAALTAQEAEEFAKEAGEKLQLTQKQVQALQSVYAGPVVKGKRIYNGLPLGSELYGCGLLEISNAAEAPFNFIHQWVLGEEYDPFAFDFEKDFAYVYETLSPYVDATSPDLSAFFGRGGKLLMVSATADPCVPYQDAYAYARAVEALCGTENFRFFIVPSIDHDIAGTRPDRVVTAEGEKLIDAAIAWAQEGKRPELLCGFVQGCGEEKASARLLAPAVPGFPEASFVYNKSNKKGRNTMTDSMKETLRNAKTQEEARAFVKTYGNELTGEDLAKICGGTDADGWKNDIPGWEGQWFYFDQQDGTNTPDWASSIPGWEKKWFYFDTGSNS